MVNLHNNIYFNIYYIYVIIRNFVSSLYGRNCILLSPFGMNFDCTKTSIVQNSSSGTDMLRATNNHNSNQQTHTQQNFFKKLFSNVIMLTDILHATLWCASSLVIKIIKLHQIIISIKYFYEAILYAINVKNNYYKSSHRNECVKIYIKHAHHCSLPNEWG